MIIQKLDENRKLDMLKAVNWPNWMEEMVKNVAGYTNVESKGLSYFLIQQKKRPLGGKYYDKFSNSDLDHLQTMELKFVQGREIVMMIDAGNDRRRCEL